MKVIDLISRLAQEPDLHAEVLMPDGFPVHVARSQPTCGCVYITDEPDEGPFDKHGMVKHDDDADRGTEHGSSLLADDSTKARALLRVIARLLDYGFHDIGYSWKGLTAKERNIIGTPDVYQDVLQFMRDNK